MRLEVRRHSVEKKAAGGNDGGGQHERDTEFRTPGAVVSYFERLVDLRDPR